MAALVAVAVPAAAQTSDNIIGSPHDLSVTGGAAVRATGETRVCVFCHTPHNAAPQSPLWNREIQEQTYTLHTSGTMTVTPQQPYGPSKLCLTCHDGTIALGSTLQPATGIAMTGGGVLPAGGPTNFGLDLSAHHPVVFRYGEAAANPEIVPSPPLDLAFGDGDEVHCSTCHNPHDDRYGSFLAVDNTAGALCTRCHQPTGWVGSAHETSTAPAPTALLRESRARFATASATAPVPSTVRELACETCHVPHAAANPDHLLRLTNEPPAPYSCVTSGCHGGGTGALGARTATPRLVGSAGTPVGGADIARQVTKVSAHPDSLDRPGAAAYVAGGPGRVDRNGVGCADCHDLHGATDQRGDGVHVSGVVGAVVGVDRNGTEVGRAAFEYELCLKCHGDDSGDRDFVPRVLETTNARLDFDPANPSVHPVFEGAANPDVPSIPSPLEPQLRATDQISCSSCHADDEGGSGGPHGSIYAPILRERYDTTGTVAESYEAFALCYRCHDRASILADESFRPVGGVVTSSNAGGHSGHLAAGIGCASCHDPHGVVRGAEETGDHTHLIDFDRREVLPVPGATFPVFRDLGSRSGSCTLVCHGVTHQGTTYP